MAQNLANHTPLVLIGLQAVAKICLKMKVMQEKYNNGMKFWLGVLIINWL